MEALFGTLFEKLMGAIFSAGAAKIGNLGARRAGRTFLFVFALLGTGFIAVASAFLWQTQRLAGISGLIDYVQKGGPAWFLTLPILAALAFVLLLIPLRGRFSLVALLCVGVMGFGLGELASFQGGSYDVNWPTIVSMLTGLVLALVGVALMFGDIPPLDSGMAHVSLVYWGRLRHLKALRQFARDRPSQVTEPSITSNAMQVSGPLDATHNVTITNSATYKLSTSNAAVLSVKIKLSSPADILAFALSLKEIRIRDAITRTLKTPRKVPLYFTLQPLPGQTIPDAFLDRLTPVLAAGRPFIGKLDIAQATPYGLQIVHNYASFVPRDMQLVAQLQWLRDLAVLLEEVSPQ